jgi:hypothetical protein
VSAPDLIPQINVIRKGKCEKDRDILLTLLILLMLLILFVLTISTVRDNHEQCIEIVHVVVLQEYLDWRCYIVRFYIQTNV